MLTTTTIREHPVTQVQMHGISNCDTIKKAKKWLADAGIEFSFRDYKQQPPSISELQQWVEMVDWELLLNKRGTTWRKLPIDQQQTVSAETVCQLLADQPSMIKRPLLLLQSGPQTQAVAGFKAEQYATIFKL
ncbi:MAG: Spx/MgsR family RNA polymerase-binding regulatory protein [Oceanospirillaceae bacterium]|jgi:Spx/MgsR family transcriptional regulator|nr:Spx/MgsR family RNA polymerase-binding regulatory protein [Oceanospirillaceae bacterium]MBT4442195.1 Spx/MgsR family RNA polymerase-binding regulatory protein [Oceanospirillaceae bacterium]MBT6076764.1 Spx/MgsR family RNA polymerase-binding regulatory protein [Oceanospirillaceae bacterium]MBT7330150.1 Spx/MgsR family RNA polymerase-binding regulatory protein [Oceanospirillaceae bacterium]